MLPGWLAGRSDKLKVYTRGEEEAGGTQWESRSTDFRLQSKAVPPENMVLDLDNSSGMGRALVEPGVQPGL